MKKTRVLALCAALVMVSIVIAACAAAPRPAGGRIAGFDARQFPAWFYEEGIWRAPVNRTAQNNFVGGFVEDASGRPSYEEIETIMNMAMLAASAGGAANWYMVVITDTATQQAITQFDVPGRPRVGSDGTVTVLAFGEALITPDQRTAPGTYSPRIGYFNLGLLTGYLNIAAMSLGYKTRIFATMAYPGVPVGERWPALERFIEGTTFTHGGTGAVHSTENMKFAMTVVIGTHNPAAIDPVLESSTTIALRPQNWSFWNPVTGAAGAARPTIVIANLADGVYTGSARGYTSTIHVRVTVASGAITGIEITEHAETEVFLRAAADSVIPQILSAQSVVGIDAVTGATEVSEGIVNAVADALRR